MASQRVQVLVIGASCIFTTVAPLCDVHQLGARGIALLKQLPALGRGIAVAAAQGGDEAGGRRGGRRRMQVGGGGGEGGCQVPAPVGGEVGELARAGDLICEWMDVWGDSDGRRLMGKVV